MSNILKKFFNERYAVSKSIDKAKREYLENEFDTWWFEYRYYNIDWYSAIVGFCFASLFWSLMFYCLG